MEKVSYQALLEVLVPAMADHRLGPGELLSPTQLAQVVGGRAGEERSLRGWCLCATGHERMFAAGAPEVAIGVTLLEPGPTAYLVTAVQRGYWQARIVVPSVGADAHDYFTALVRERSVQLALARDNSDQALVLRVALADAAVNRLAAQPRVLEVDPPEFLADYVQLLGRLLQPAALLPLPDMPAVREACVVYILPAGMSFLDALAPAVTATVQ